MGTVIASIAVLLTGGLVVSYYRTRAKALSLTLDSDKADFALEKKQKEVPQINPGASPSAPPVSPKEGEEYWNKELNK